jgi:hypothetical protein
VKSGVCITSSLHFVNECRVADTFGVAVAFGRSNTADEIQSPVSPEHIALAARLHAVTKRCKVDLPSSATSEEPAKPQAQVQRFFTPQEAAENGRG